MRGPMSRFLNRFLRAAKLDASLYQEIVEDGGAMNQALSYESTSRALGVCIIGLIISAVFQGLIFIIMFSAFSVSAR